MATLKQGDVIHGYRIVEEFRIANGGNCEWTFAEKNGACYFVKVFFSPKYPVKALGSPETITKRQEACYEFEQHQKKLLLRAGAVAGAGGRLVVPTDFFRSDAFYYKVADRIDTVAIDATEISDMLISHKLSVMMTVSSAIRALHNAGIVHGDLSPSNILISAKGDGFVANVIDFDSSYLASQPPSPHLLVGNPPYHSPELLAYLQGEADGATLTTQSDVFALGLVYWLYTFGRLPAVDPPLHYASEAVLAGQRLAPPAVADRPILGDLIERMVHRDPGERPTMSVVQAELKALQKGDTRPFPAPRPAASPRIAGLKMPRGRRPSTPVVVVRSSSRVKFKRRSE